MNMPNAPVVQFGGLAIFVRVVGYLLLILGTTGLIFVVAMMEGKVAPATQGLLAGLMAGVYILPGIVLALIARDVRDGKGGALLTGFIISLLLTLSYLFGVAMQFWTMTPDRDPDPLRVILGVIFAGLMASLTMHLWSAMKKRVPPQPSRRRSSRRAKA